jgi:dephospho-CoA kinase
MIFAIIGLPQSGKSTVLKILEKQGFDTIDCDQIVQKLYEANGLGTNKIANYFGDEFLKKDGSVNKNKLAKSVFNSFQKLKILESFIHPLIVHEIKVFLSHIKSKNAFIEITAYRKTAKINQLIDKWILIKNPKIDIKNIKGFNLSQFHEDLNSIKADIIIENKNTILDLEKQVKNFDFN